MTASYVPVSRDGRTIAGRVTAQLSLAIGLLLLIATVLVTLDIRYRSIANVQRAIDGEQKQYAANEDVRFAKIAAVEQNARRIFKAQLAALGPEDDRLFEQLFPLSADGVRRSRDGLFDGMDVPGLGPVNGFAAFIAGGDRLTPADRRQLMAAFLSIRLLGEGIRPELNSLYFYTPHDQLLIFAPDRPDRLDFYRHKAPASFSFQKEEFADIVRPERNPARTVRCTSLQRIVYDRTGRTWTTGCMTPVDLGGRHVGSFGISLLLDRLSAPLSLGRGTPILVSREGRLIYHPQYTRQADRGTAGNLDLTKTRDPQLKALWAFLQAHRNQPDFVGYVGGMDAYVALGTVNIPGWYALSTIPATSVNAAASYAARWVMLMGLVILLLQALILRHVLRRQVGEPIGELTTRAEALADMASHGGWSDDGAAQIVMPADGSELERLDASFATMESRVMAERRRLKRSFDLFAASVGNVALFMLDRHGHVLNWNRGAEQITGIAAGEAIAAHFSLFFGDGEDASALASSILAAAASGQVRGQHSLYRQDGSEFFAQLHIDPIVAVDGALTGYAVVMTDVTQQRAQERKIAENLQVLRMAEDTAELGHWRHDLVTNGVEWSPWMYRIFGVAESTSLDIHFVMKRYTAASITLMKERLTFAHKNRSPFAFQVDVIRSDGAIRHVEIKGQPEFNVAGQNIAMVGVLRDITDQIEAQVELISARNAADAAARARTEFLAVMSHEIRTPMSGIIGMLETLDATMTGSGRATAIASIQRSSRTLMRVLDDVLDHSTIETGSLSLETIPFDLAEVVEQTAELFRAKAVGKGITLYCSGERPLWVAGDPTRVQQIISNFASNAIKFTASGLIEMTWRYAAGMCRIEVSDSGIGMDDETLARLFTAFSQASAATTRQFGGTGLGLAICKRLAEAMGGSVGASSQMGRGSRFWVELPLAPAAAMRQEEPEALPPLENSRGERPRVLLVEDSDSVRIATEAQLEALGCSVQSVTDGLAAVAVLASNSFDAVVMDCNMPVLDGPAAARLVRMLPGGGPPILGLTAHSDSELLAGLVDAGMNAVATKPLWRPALHRALAPLISRPPLPVTDMRAAAYTTLAAFPESVRAMLADSIMRDMIRLAGDVGTAIGNGDGLAAGAALHGLRGVAETLGARDLAALTLFGEAVLSAVGPAPCRWLADLIGDSVAATLAAAGPAFAAIGRAA